jgi:hypothetical protein
LKANSVFNRYMEPVFSTDYFIMFGVLFALYCLIRIALWREFQLHPRQPPSTPYLGMATSINTSALADRLQQVRQDRLAQAREQSPSFKKSLLVESRREELSRHSYFHKLPTPPEPPEEEHGLTVLLV